MSFGRYLLAGLGGVTWFVLGPVAAASIVAHFTLGDYLEHASPWALIAIPYFGLWLGTSFWLFSVLERRLP